MQSQKQGYRIKILKPRYLKVEIPDDWDCLDLEKLTTKITDIDHKMPIKTDSGIVFLAAKNLTQTNEIDFSDIEYISEEDYVHHSKKFNAEKNDILISRIGSIGYARVIRTDKRLIASYSVALLKPKKSINSDFLNYSLNSKIPQTVMGAYTIVVGNTNLILSDLKKVPIIYPKSLLEQQKIVSILSNVDSEISQTQKIIEQIQTLKKGLMQKLLTKGIRHSKFKEYCFTNTGIVSLGSIPTDWDIETIGELRKTGTIIEFQDGNHGELHPKSEDFIDNGKPFLTASQIDEDGNIDLSRCKRLPEILCDKLRIGFSQAKDVLFTHNATVGRVAVLPEDFPDCIVGTSVTYYRLNENMLDRFFFSYVLQSNFIKKQYGTDMDQTTRQQFSIQKQATLKIPLPKLAEQKKISTNLLNLDLEIHNEQKHKFKLNTLKKGLMQKILTGQIRVKV